MGGQARGTGGGKGEDRGQIVVINGKDTVCVFVCEGVYMCVCTNVHVYT